MAPAKKCKVCGEHGKHTCAGLKGKKAAAKRSKEKRAEEHAERLKKDFAALAKVPLRSRHFPQKEPTPPVITSPKDLEPQFTKVIVDVTLVGRNPYSDTYTVSRRSEALLSGTQSRSPGAIGRAVKLTAMRQIHAMIEATRRGG